MLLVGIPFSPTRTPPVGRDLPLTDSRLDGVNGDTSLRSRSQMAQLSGRQHSSPPSWPASANPEVIRSYGMAARAARAGISVLIMGETGVGKEILAACIHRHSPRATAPFVTINCAGVCESLAESELFGHERGAFTGASEARVGLLEAAAGGTVFLDEVGEMSLATQARLLRVIDTRKVLPVGSRQTRSIDVRFLAATNRNLEQEVRRGTFREDLFYRLNGICLTLPPLRRRLEDLPALVESILADAGREQGRTGHGISPEALDLLASHEWPGNIRELKNVLARALLFSDGPIIRVEDLSLPAATRSAPAPQLQPPDRRQHIIDVLVQCGWNQGRAAGLLGMSRRTLITRLDQYDIPRPQKGHEGFAEVATLPRSARVG
jgi:two-component system response regulator AtoC